MFAPEAASFGLDPASLVDRAPEKQARGGVLLVEDEPSIGILLEQLFQRAARPIWIAASGGAGLELFAAHQARIAIAIIDCHLPDLPGADLARRLRARAPGLPLLLTSGRDQRLLAASLTPSGRTVFLPKPYRPGEIVAQVDQLLAR
jgi:two-component system catabolic regulation response regulator CreB